LQQTLKKPKSSLKKDRPQRKNKLNQEFKFWSAIQSIKMPPNTNMKKHICFTEKKFYIYLRKNKQFYSIHSVLYLLKFEQGFGVLGLGGFGL
jgi:hypothetical protein